MFYWYVFCDIRQKFHTARFCLEERDIEIVTSCENLVLKHIQVLHWQKSYAVGSGHVLLSFWKFTAWSVDVVRPVHIPTNGPLQDTF